MTRPSRANSRSLLQQAMGADQNVDLVLLDRLGDLAHLLGGAEARHHVDPHRERLQAPAEGLEVLVGEDGGRREHRHLIARVDRLERGAHGDLGLAEADVAAEQSVHRPRALEVLLDRFGGGELVVGLVELERRLELALEIGVGEERRRLRELALGVELRAAPSPCRARWRARGSWSCASSSRRAGRGAARCPRCRCSAGSDRGARAAAAASCPRGRRSPSPRRRRRPRRRGRRPPSSSIARPRHPVAAPRTGARAVRSPDRCRGRRARRSRPPSSRAGR